MYSLFSNEKLGMPVEEMRLREIRQQIEAQRLGGQMKPTQAERMTEFLYRALYRLRISSRNMSRIEAQVDPTALR